MRRQHGGSTQSFTTFCARPLPGSAPAIVNQVQISSSGFQIPLPLRHSPCCAHSPTALPLPLPSIVCFIFHSAPCAGTRLLQIEHVSTLCNAYVYVVCRTRFFSRDLHPITVSHLFPYWRRQHPSSPQGGLFTSGFQIVCGGILTTHTTPEKSHHLYLCTPKEPGPFHHSHIPSSACSFNCRPSPPLVTVYCHAAGIAKNFLSSLGLLSMCHWLSTFCFSRLSRFLLFVSFVTRHGF
ncbi:hypothetical protein EV702DRAFT_777613 [Suillus placidus]|uniref:Uncharacterized protein n=1 Tax=Suillus placidus TaxID=48579 RepID=A0A9P7D4X3_9AGAM|nr:hypothetical protein EV702DRAFT_777613 [Suillus placidus]